MKNSRGKSLMGWSWIIIVVFFALSFIDTRFGIFGFVCMAVPMIIAAIGKGRMHCSHICPRGSFFGKFLPYLSFKKPLPKWMKKNAFKYTLMTLMFSRFIWSIYITWGNYTALSKAVFSFMFASFIVGLLMGIFFLPRSWCQICPMGQFAHLIDKGLYKNNKKKQKSSPAALEK